MATTQEVLSETRSKMSRSVEALSRELSGIRTGRASPALVEHLEVEYYGAHTPLNQISSVSVPEPRTLMIQPWDKQALTAIEKCILKSDLNLVPNNDGTVIRINLPNLTEERRKDLVKVVGKKTEEGHVSVRNIRRESMETLRKMEKAKELSQDDARRAQEELQSITDGFIKQMDAARHTKEEEVMEV